MNPRTPILLSLLLLVLSSLAAGCEGDGLGADATDAVDATDVAEPADVVDAADAVEVTPSPDVPILERPLAASHACVETLPPTGPIEPIGGGLPELVADGDRAYALRTGSTFGILPVGIDGSLGATIAVAGSPYTEQSATLAAAGGRFSLLWVEGTPNGQQQLRFALIRDGAVQVAPKALAGTTAASLGAPDSAPADGGGTALLWMASDGSARTRLLFARVDDAGAFTVGPVELHASPQPYGAQGVSLARVGSGFAAAWTSTQASGGSEVWFTRVDAAGAIVVAPRRVSAASGDGWHFQVAGWRTGGTPLLADGDRVWLAYSATYFDGDYGSPTGWTNVELAVIDAAGRVVSHPLQAAVNDVTATDPTLFRLDDTLGVLWSQGATIYVCAGCYVDNDLKVVLLDPRALAPVSAVATHAHAEHGYVRPSAVVVGSDVLSLSAQDFHALSVPAVSVMTCAALP